MSTIKSETKMVYITNTQVQQFVSVITRQMAIDEWKPDYVVGITRGGLVPALMISHYLQVPMKTLDVSLRDNGGLGPESNLWMAEDAFGYVPDEERGDYFASEYDCWHPRKAKNILLVDDINDEGSTLNWIANDWKSGCLPDHIRWETVWNENVRFATLVDNAASKFKHGVDYTALEINKAEDDCWIMFPWEDFWERGE